MNTLNTRQVGSDEEELAADYLRGKGYFIIQKNYRVRQGEIDIIARDGQTIVFVEVKYRKNAGAGHPLEAVTFSKQKQICKTALFYLNQNKINPEVTPVRFDVIGILGTEITHIENAFSYVR
jgi:putative endonuclease